MAWRLKFIGVPTPEDMEKHLPLYCTLYFACVDLSRLPCTSEKLIAGPTASTMSPYNQYFSGCEAFLRNIKKTLKNSFTGHFSGKMAQGACHKSSYLEHITQSPGKVPRAQYLPAKINKQVSQKIEK